MVVYSWESEFVLGLKTMISSNKDNDQSFLNASTFLSKVVLQKVSGGRILKGFHEFYRVNQAFTSSMPKPPSFVKYGSRC